MPVTRQSPVEDLLAVAAATEQAFDEVFGALLADVPAATGVETRTVTITGVDGNDITLYVTAPPARRPLPGLLHLHGGGMAILHAADEVAARWRALLAERGCVVVGVEFRNSAGSPWPAPVPGRAQRLRQRTGLDARPARRRSGCRRSSSPASPGGGNLSLATALKAKREGRLDRIDGVYAQVPFIYGGYDTPDPALASLIENEGYFLGPSVMTLMAALYDPTGEHATDPLAWPYYADVDDLAGLPPHVVTTDELDPLRDEGLAYLRALQRAGVDASGHTYNGVGTRR